MKNLIWVYGPNVSLNTPDGTRDVLYYYPGDDVVDILGVDWYTGGNRELNAPSGHSYDKIMSRGKPCALTEFGPSGAIRAPKGSGVAVQEKLFNSLDMVALIKSYINTGLKISYVLTWTGGCGAIHSIGKGEEALADPFCIDLERLNKLYS